MLVIFAAGDCQSKLPLHLFSNMCWNSFEAVCKILLAYNICIYIYYKLEIFYTQLMYMYIFEMIIHRTYNGVSLRILEAPHVRKYIVC